MEYLIYCFNFALNARHTVISELTFDVWFKISLVLSSDGLNLGFNYEKSKFFLLFLWVDGGMEAEEKVRERLKKRG